MYLNSRITFQSVSRAVIFLLTAYWVAMTVVGFPLIEFNHFFVKIIDLNLVPQALALYVLAFVFFLFGLATYAACMRAIGNQRTEYLSLTLSPIVGVRTIPIVAMLFLCAGCLALTFAAAGYIPLFHDDPGAKYFQDAQEEYIPFRPLYTFGLFGLAMLSTVMLTMLFSDHLSIKKKLAVGGLYLLATSILVLSAKRGPIFTQLVYVGLALVLAKRIRGTTALLALLAIVVAATALHAVHIAYDDADTPFEGLVLSFANSYFVGPRELTRLLTIFEGDYLYGLTYLAPLISWIPTSMSEFKAKFIYARYVTLLEGENPDDSGGMRSTFMGEAFINFDLPGVIAISFLFGIFTPIAVRYVLKTSLLPDNALLRLTGVSLLIHQFHLSFFENGSVILFPLASNFILYFLCVRLCCVFPRTMKESTSRAANGGSSMVQRTSLTPLR